MRRLAVSSGAFFLCHLLTACGIVFSTASVHNALGDEAAPKENQNKWASATPLALAQEYRREFAEACRLSVDDFQSSRAREVAAGEIQDEQIRRAREWWKSHPDGEKLLRTLDDAQLLLLLAMHRPVARLQPSIFDPSPTDPQTENRRRTVNIDELLRRGGWDEVVAKWEWPSITELPDKRLQELWNVLRDPNRGLLDRNGTNQERLLSEMSRRGGKSWEEFLAVDLKRVATHHDQFQTDERNLERLTALRRIQGKSDPVVVQIRQRELTSTFPELPELDAELVNVDRDQESVNLQLGGDYRSGRSELWRIEATDGTGHVLGPGDWVAIMGGGLSSTRVLAFGERQEMSLDVGSFVPMLVPGNYSLQALYHDRLEIAGRASTENLIVCRSSPIKLTVKPLVLKGGAETKKRVQDLLARLPSKPPLTIIAGTYGEWASSHLSTDSAQAEILALKFEAIPGLLDSLEAQNLEAIRRAEILGLLFSITSQNDPRHADGVLPAYDAWIGPWAIGTGGGIAISLGGEEHFYVGDIDVVKQKEFAAKWRAWRKYILLAI
jgi:hypothetical protein